MKRKEIRNYSITIAYLSFILVTYGFLKLYIIGSYLWPIIGVSMIANLIVLSNGIDKFSNMTLFYDLPFIIQGLIVFILITSLVFGSVYGVFSLISDTGLSNNTYFLKASFVFSIVCLGTYISLFQRSK
tara:strand:- start:374 stop:760 length:387 start_codon:yes stop_codon:yes gene_type:complete